MGKYNKQISPERKSLYYWGMALTGIGLLMFLSTFVTFMANFGNFDHFESRARSEGFRSFGGMILMMIGGFMMNVAKMGLAGSGILLDPEKARTDVEPWSRLQGGVIQDALSEVDVVKKLEDAWNHPKPQIKVRCGKCQALNDEAAKFCNQCGATI